jgi:transposase
MDIELKIDPEDARYAYYETMSWHGEVEQKWVLVYSSDMEKKMERTFEKNLAKQKSDGEKSLARLKKKEFACEADAVEYALEWVKKYPLLELLEVQATCKNRRLSGAKGRPKKDEVLKEVYFIEGKLVESASAVSRERRSLGRFILSSNAIMLGGKEMLGIYKEQMHVERGFRFLKNKSFLVSETYLKKPERIESLAFIMVLCLMVYSLLEYRLREGLKKQEKTIPNSLKKPTNRPTLQWAFSFFTSIAEVGFFVGGINKSTSLSKPHNMEAVLIILTALGMPYEKFYSWT